MIKKLMFLSLVCTSGYASNAYIGGQVGLDMLVVRHSTDYPIAERHHLGNFGVSGGGFLGYNFTFCQDYDLGVEGFFFGNSTEIDKRRFDLYPNNFHVHSSYNWGFRVLPGMVLCNGVEMHAIVGYTRGYFHLRDHGPFDFRRQVEANGYQVGGGIRMDMANNLSFRFDGVFNGYENSRHRHHFVTVDDVDIDHHHHIRANDFTASVALIYNF